MTTKGHGAGPGSAPIAIIGMGCCFPGAANLTEFWRALARGEDGISEVPPTHWSAKDYFDPDPKRPDHTYCTRGGFLSPVSFDPTEFGIPPTILEATDTSQLLSLVVARAALEDAGYSEDREFNRERVSVILGVTGTQELVIPLAARLGHPLWRRALAEAGISAELAERVIERIADGYVSWQENSFPGLLGNVVAGRIANRLNLRGTNCVIDAACASSLGAVHLAMMELAAGRSDMVVTGGADTLNDIFMHMCFSKTPALSPTGDARPFDADADGTVLGEGIGMLVLKRLEDAQRDGDRIYAVIRAVGTSSDGRSQSIYAPHAAGQARCLRNAYTLSGVEPGTVGLIEAHGTGTKVGDAVEFEALKTVFREDRSDGTWCAVGSVKSQIGHTKAAAGAAGLIKAALAIYHRALPPTIKIRQPNPKLAIDESPFYLNTELRPWLSPGSSNGAAPTPRRAGVSSFGFGGSNFHAVLEEHRAALPQTAWDGSVQIIALSAQSVGGLLDQLDALRNESAAPHFGAEQLAWRASESRRTFDVRHAHRLVLVVERGEKVREKVAEVLGELVERVRNRLATGDSNSAWSADGAYYGTGTVEGAIGFVFPGQGSQYVGMARRLVCIFPEMQEILSRFDSTATDTSDRIGEAIYPAPALTAEARAAHEAHLRQTQIAQPAIGAISVGLSRVLERFVIRPQAVCGHSYGELVALHFAGYINESTLVDLTRLRGRLMAGEGPLRGGAETRASGGDDRGAMLAVKAPLDELAKLAGEAGLDVVLANRNSPAQGVLSGSSAAIADATERCKARGFVSKRLQVSGAFHSRLMEDAVGPFRNAVEAATFSAPRLPVIAHATAQVYPSEAAAAKALLARQLISPVDFVGQIETMYAAGVRCFVEVGPRAVLTGLIGPILGDRSHTARAVDASAGHRCGLADLARLLAELSAAGHAVDWLQWERPVREPRKPRMVVPLVGANYRSSGDAAKRLLVQTLDASSEQGNNVSGRPWSDEPEIEGSREEASCESSPPMTSKAELCQYEHSATNKAKRVVNNESDVGRDARNRPADRPSVSAALPTPANPALGEALRVLQDGLRAMQTLQQQTAAAHQRFLETQEQAHRSIQRLIESQAGLMTGAPIAPFMSASVENVAIADREMLHAVSTVRTVGQDSEPTHQVPRSVPESSKPESSSPESQDSGLHPKTATRDLQSEITTVVLDVVCEKTGYPREMVAPEMDIEADLGIDSIKRVEIIAAVEERLPGLPQIKPEHMGSIRTLAQIVDFLGSGASANSASLPGAKCRSADANTECSVHAASQDSGHRSQVSSHHPQSGIQDTKPRITETVLAVVCEKTGYPREMVAPEMDIEADLGIDSIKRVEIIAAVEERLPGLPQIKPEHMGTLRTLAQIINFLSGGDDRQTASPTAAAPADVTVGNPQSPTALTANRTIQPRDASSATIRRSVLTCKRVESLEAVDCIMADGCEVLITEDGHGLAPAIRAALLRHAVSARVVSLQEAARLKRTAEISGLIITSPIVVGSPATGRDSMDAFLRDALLAARVACVPLTRVAEAGGAFFATISRMDGAFGLVGDGFEPVCGALAGLAKTAAREWPGVRVRAIDVASDWSDRAAAGDAIVRELFVDGPVEVGLDANGRIELDAVPQSVEAGESSLRPGDVVVISGGARGVTAEAAVALARAYSPTLVLLGRSAAPEDEPAWLAMQSTEAEIKQAILRHEFVGRRPSPAQLQAAFAARMAAREIAKNLDRISATGATVVYRQVDVCDAKAVRVALSQIRERYGPIRGIVHGAGVLEDRLIRDKTPEQFDRVYETKVGGLRNLLHAASPGDLRQLVMFSSVSARYGNVGQVDYAMANEAMNKIAQRLSRELSDCRVVSINWGPWDGGMVTAAHKREFAGRGVELIPLEAGADALVAEMSVAGRAVEVVIGAPLDQAGQQKKVPSAATTRTIPLSVAFERELDLQRHPFLRSHVLGGRPVLPAAMMLEWLAQASLHANPGLILQGVENLRVLRPVAVDAAVKMLQLAVARPRRYNGTFTVDTELRTHDEASRFVVHAHATVLLGTQVPLAPSAPESHSVIDRAYPRSVEEAYEAYLFHGPHFQGIREICGLSDRGMVARVRSAGAPRDWMSEPLRSAWLIDPLQIDVAFQLAILWCCEQMGAPSLPSYLGRYRQYAAELPAEGSSCILQVRDTSRSKLTADIAWVDAAGVLVADLTGCECTVDPLLAKAFRHAAEHAGT